MHSDESVKEEFKEASMKATFRALCKHGYADLTMQKIADESDKCKSTFHYHYNTKENLITHFIEYLLEGFEEKMVPDTDDPLEKLNGLIDNMLFGLTDEETTMSLHTALLEIRSQAPYNDKFREQITQNDEHILNVVSGIIEDGIEKGRFKEVDSRKMATAVISAIDGARARQISTNRKATEELKKSLHWIIKELLLK